jgi:hypothetical protein
MAKMILIGCITLNKSFKRVSDGAKTLPALSVILVDLRELLHGKLGCLEKIAGLKHKSKVLLPNLEGLLLTQHEPLIGISIRPMRRHRGMERRASRNKPTRLLRIVFSRNITHELSHAVPVVVWRLEGMLSHQPTRREDHEV